MRFGFVGYGNMGAVLLNGLLERGAIAEDEIIVTNRTLKKLDRLKDAHPGVNVVGSCQEVAFADVIFLCIRTGDVKCVLEKMSPWLDPSAHLVSINGGLQIKNLERLFPGKITKAIPSMTMASGHGVTLVCHNGAVDPTSARTIEGLFGRVGLVQIVKEDQFEVAADLTSCAPAFIADHGAEVRRGRFEKKRPGRRYPPAHAGGNVAGHGIDPFIRGGLVRRTEVEGGDERRDHRTGIGGARPRPPGSVRYGPRGDDLQA